VLLRQSDEPSIDTAGLRGATVGAVRVRGHVFSAVVFRANRDRLFAIEPRLSRRLRIADPESLVERHRPTRRQVVRHERGGVEVARLLHRLAELHRQPAVSRLRQTIRQEQVLPRSRRRVLARRAGGEADAADAQDVGDEGEARAVPDEQHGAARRLALYFLDAPQAAAGQLGLGLPEAIGPGQVDEVGLRRAAESQ
jgi:hypothetical protein